MSISQIKAKALEQLEGKKKDAAITLLVYIIITAVISGITTNLFPGETIRIGDYLIKRASYAASIIQTLVSIFLSLGLTSYFLKIARGESPDVMELFSKGNIYLRVVGTSILVGVAVFFGTLALIIPGIILAFAYSMVELIYMDNPDIGITDVMTKSREMMKGHKFDLFVLGLSFIGWAILGIFTLGLLYFWLIPYMGVSTAIFYDDIKDN